MGGGVSGVSGYTPGERVVIKRSARRSSRRIETDLVEESAESAVALDGWDLDTGDDFCPVCDGMMRCNTPAWCAVQRAEILARFR